MQEPSTLFYVLLLWSFQPVSAASSKRSSWNSVLYKSSFLLGNNQALFWLRSTGVWWTWKSVSHVSHTCSGTVNILRSTEMWEEKDGWSGAWNIWMGEPDVLMRGLEHLLNWAYSCFFFSPFSENICCILSFLFPCFSTQTCSLTSSGSILTAVLEGAIIDIEM